MDISLTYKPKKPIIITGFPGFGLVGTIAIEFLIEHLNAKEIGKIRIEEGAPMVAIHDNKVVEPLGIFYDKRSNIVILHALTGVAGFEWQISNTLAKLAKDLNAKEIISIEGVSTPVETKEIKAFYLCEKRDAFKRIGVEPLKEGVIMGVTGALLLKKDIPVSCIFVETHSALPDSRGAAKIIQLLDRYLGLKIDYKPLLEKAEKFEGKIKQIIEKSKHVQSQRERKELSYLG